MGANAQRRRLASAPPAAPQQGVELTSVTLRLATGRPAIISVPTDASDIEVLSIINGVTQLADRLRAQRLQGPASRLLIPQ